MRKEVCIAGFGGQGIVLAGLILGDAAIRDGKYAVQTQSYGPESRGGAARSEVIISNEKIDYPRVIDADILVALSQTAYDKYHKTVKKKNSLIFIDSDLVNAENKSLRAVPFTKIADNLGKKMMANSVMLGYLLGITGIIALKSMEDTIRDNVPGSTIDMNLKAFYEGYKLSNK